MDHHRAAPYAVLWSNIDTGIGSRTFESSGDGEANGNHTASFVTFWNVRYILEQAGSCSSQLICLLATTAAAAFTVVCGSTDFVLPLAQD